MKFNSWLFYWGAVVFSVLPLFYAFIGLGVPDDSYYLRNIIVVSTLIICAVMVDGFNAVIDKLGGM